MTLLQRICRINLKNCLNVATKFYGTQIVKPINLNIPSVTASFTVKNPWIWKKETGIETPVITNISPVIELPRSMFWIPSKSDPELNSNTQIEDPITEINKHEKLAVKLIVIRKHKMRKHKLKKLRKKMKFEWAKRRQRREMRKEKAFQAELLAQIKEAENFSAKEFVAEKIRKATEVPIPRYWKGKRLPEFIIREKLSLPPK